MTAPKFTLPRDDEHTTIVGRNGTGKSQFGFWVLSTRDLKAKPYYLLDYKGEQLIDMIDRAREIDFSETPRQPGLYILHSRPDLEDETEEWLWRIWEGENAGLFIDEGYMLPNASKKGAFDALLTQGRSKRTPVITLSQRPVKVSRTAFSEASHVIAFDLNDDRDRKTLEEVVPKGFMDDKLPPFHAKWYSVKQDHRWNVKPVPNANKIVNDINVQLEPKKRWL